MPLPVDFVRRGLQTFIRLFFQNLITELILKPVLIFILFGLGLLIIGLTVGWFVLLPSSGTKEVVKDFNQFLKLHRLEDSKEVFLKHGVTDEYSFAALDVNKLQFNSNSKQNQKTADRVQKVISKIKDEKLIELWLEQNGLSQVYAARLKDYGITNLDFLSKINDDMIQDITKIDNTLQDYGSMKTAVKNLRPSRDVLEQQLLQDKIHGQHRPIWKNVLFFILTILIGGLLIVFIMVMECMYGLRNAISRQGRLVSPAMTGSTGTVRPSLLPNPEKSWLWKLFWGVSVFPQHCVVKWEWTEPQLVGNTMTFTVQLFRKNGKPFAALDANSIFVEIFHKGTKVAYTKQLDRNDPDSNTIKVSFTVHKAGEYRITIMVSGRHIKDSPFIKRFEAGPIDAGRTGFTNYCSTIVCTAGVPYPLTIETQDTFGNPAVYKADQNNYFKIKVVQTENSIKYVPATQMIYNPEQKQLTMHIRMEKEGCYQATVSYGDVKLRNGDFNLLVISVDDMSRVNKNLARKSHNIWYEARLLSGDPESNDKAKRVYVYISPKQMTLKEYYLKVIGKKLYTWRVCPSTKFYFNGYNSRYEAPVVTIHDGSQPPVVLAAKDRSVIAATFTNFLLRNIGGSETFQDKQLFFSQEVRRFHKKGSLTLKIDRLNLLYSSYRATKNFDASDWYKSFQIVFQGEQGLDWGGLRREWFELVCTSLFDPGHSGLFTRFTEDTQGLVHPNPKRSNDLKLKMYEFAGKIVGKCLYDSALGSAYRQLVKARFSRSFLAQLIGLQINYKYFEADDPELYKTKIRYIDENPIDEMELTFSEEEYTNDGHLLKVVDLIPGGGKLSVTNENKQHYLNCLAQYKLVSCVREEVDHFLKGLNLLIPDNLLSIFDENELELLMCGTGNYSITDFKAHAVIDGSSFSFPKVLDWFWTIVASFTEEQMARLLQFTTGCSQLPAGGFRELNPKFQISFSPTYNTLPTAHTCFNQLCLPDYDTIDNFHKSLLIAINEGSQGFGLV